MKQQIDINSIDFAALSLNQTAYSQPNGMFRGWGSEETRKAYASLEKLDSQNHAHLVNSQALSTSAIPTNENSSIDGGDDEFFISEDDMDFW
jgi:hypothetical protein